MAATVRASFPGATNATAVAAGGTVSQSVTVVSGDVLEAHAVVSSTADSGMTAAMTANGVAASGSSGAVHSNGQTAGFEQVFYWTAPATGTYNVTLTVSGGTPDSVAIKVYAITGSDGNAPAITTFAPSGTGTTTAASITSGTLPTGSVAISHFCAGSTFSAVSDTLVLNAPDPGGSSAANDMCGGSFAGAGATHNFTATISAAEWYAAIVTVWSTAGPATTPEQYHAHWRLVPPGGISPASPRMFPFPAFGTGDTTPNTPQATTWFTAIGDTTTPELLVSAEDWGLLPNGGLQHAGDFAATFDDYFSHRQAQGYNCVLVSMFSFTGLSGAANGPDSDGTYPFNTNSTNPSNTPNTTFWARRDSFVSTAATYGFRVMLNVSTPYVHVGPSFTASWTNTQWTNFGTFLGNRYAASPNILWMLGDDYFDDIDSGFTAFLAALRAAGADQPVSIQNYQETSSRKDIFDGGTRPWGFTNAEYNFGYSYNVSYDVVEKMGLEANPLPYLWADGTFLSTGGLSGVTDVQLMRRLIWWALSSGSKGFQVGDNDMWPWDASALGFVTSKSFYTTVVPAIASYFRSLPNWHQLKADTSSQLVTGGRGTHATPLASGGSGGQYLSDTDSYVTASWIQGGADAGTLAVIYMSHGSTITIDESKMVAGYTATWVDPKTAATSAATPGSTYNSTAKGSNSDGQADWVLVLQAPGSGVNGSAAPALTVTVTAAGVVGVVGQASQTLTVAAGEDGSTNIEGAATRALAVSVNAAGTVEVTDAPSVQLTLSVTATGSLTGGAFNGTASAPLAVTVTAAGQVGTSAGAAPSLTVGVTDVGQVATSAGAAASLSVNVSAAGQVALTTGAAASLSVSTTAAGSVSSAGTGQAAPVETVTVTAAGTVARSSGSTSAETVATTTSGAVGKAAGVTATETLTATAAGLVAGGGQVSAALAVTTTATGNMAAAGTSVPALAVTVVATGSISRSGQSARALSVNVTAAGVASAGPQPDDGVPVDRPILSLTSTSPVLTLDGRPSLVLDDTTPVLTLGAT